MDKANEHLIVVSPVFNDWSALGILISKLDEIAASLPCPVSVIIVNDGSTTDFDYNQLPRFSHLSEIKIVDLFCNLGHQRAIAVGTSLAVRDARCSSVLIMDSDGEDSPEDILKLYRSYAENNQVITVAHRKKRSENMVFRIFYSIYKGLFILFTGKIIDFGNFCILPVAQARRIVYSPDCWNHLAASIVKSRILLIKLPTVRGKRFDGKSSMSLVSLILHGFGSLSVFSETVLTRLLLLVGTVSCSSVLLVVIAIIIKFCTDLAIPGWATNVALLSILLLFQALIIFVILISGNLSNRSIQPFIAATDSERFCRGETILKPVATHGNL